jgi:hypothetical protein
LSALAARNWLGDFDDCVSGHALALRGVDVTLVLVLTLALVLAIAPPLSLSLLGADDPEVAVAVTIDGKGTKGAKERLQEAVRSGLDRSGVKVMPSGSVTAPAKGCEDDACWQALASDAGASHVVVTAVTKEGRDYVFELHLVDADSGNVVASNNDRCEICGIDEVADLVSSKAAALGGQLVSASDDAPVLVVESNPVGAVVTVDGKRAGKTPFEGELPPGRHVVRVEKPGHVTVERDLDLDAGVRSQADFNLERISEVQVRKGIRPVGWGVLAGGRALLGGGVALLTVDDKPAKGRCDGDNQDADGDCKFLINTMWGGASLEVVGGAAIATGVAILVVTRSSSGKSGKRARLIPAVGPMSVGISGRF